MWAHPSSAPYGAECQCCSGAQPPPAFADHARLWPTPSCCAGQPPATAAPPPAAAMPPGCCAPPRVRRANAAPAPRRPLERRQFRWCAAFLCYSQGRARSRITRLKGVGRTGEHGKDWGLLEGVVPWVPLPATPDQDCAGAHRHRVPSLVCPAGTCKLWLEQDCAAEAKQTAFPAAAPKLAARPGRRQPPQRWWLSSQCSQCHTSSLGMRAPHGIRAAASQRYTTHPPDGRRRSAGRPLTAAPLCVCASLGKAQSRGRRNKQRTVGVSANDLSVLTPPTTAVPEVSPRTSSTATQTNGLWQRW